MNTPPALKDKKVTVMGLGLHGGALGTIKWLLDQKAIVTVTDLKSEDQLAPTMEQLANMPIRFVLGKHEESDFTSADLVIRNPGVPKNSPYLQAAQKANVPVEMDSSLFFLHCLSKNIIGITGSKGKTTTAKAITAVLSAGGKEVVEVGTDGISPLGKLSSITEETIVVFELSSWRLEALEAHTMSPHIAVVTSIYREHLNTYSSFQEYIDTKKIIVRYQSEEDIAILNKDDSELRNWEPEIKGELLWYSADDSLDSILAGSHQARNLVPANIIGSLYGVSDKVIADTIHSFEGLPHRLETVTTKDDVTFVNDSAATMPDATIAALEAFRDKNIVLILGGSDKELEFSKLADKIHESNISALVWLPGTATERMQAEIATSDSPKSFATGSMPEAVNQAAAVATAGDIVLLSPGATSFGLFQHEFDRGDQFRDSVLRLDKNR